MAFFDGENPNTESDWNGFQAALRTRKSAVLPRPTGLTYLDPLIGGLRGLTLLAGPTGSGKTSLAVELCISYLRANPKHAVILLELESPKIAIFQKIAAHEMNTPFSELFCAKPEGYTTDSICEQARELLTESVLQRLKVIDVNSETLRGFTAESLAITAISHCQASDAKCVSW